MFIITDAIRKTVTWKLIKDSTLAGDSQLSADERFYDNSDIKVDYYLSYDGFRFYIKQHGKKENLTSTRSYSLEEFAEMISIPFESLSKETIEKLYCDIIQNYNALTASTYSAGVGWHLKKY